MDILSVADTVLSITFPTQVVFEKRYAEECDDQDGVAAQLLRWSSVDKNTPQGAFTILSIAREGATDATIHCAYRKLAIQWHPHKNSHSESSKLMMHTLGQVLLPVKSCCCSFGGVRR